MKKLSFLLFAALGLLFANNTIAQVSHGGEPMFNRSTAKIASPDISMPILDNEVYLNEDLNAFKGAGPMRIGIMQETRVNILDNANVIKDADGTHFLMSVTSPKATFVSLHFSQFQLPEGAQIFFYDESGEFVLGSFIAENAQDDGTFYTQSIPGSTAYIEYNVPAGSEPGQIVLDAVCHGYKDIFRSMAETYRDKADALKGAHGDAEGNCHINVVCPDGDDWRDQIRSVVALEIIAGGGVYMCSGALINNTRQDKTPYVLSAYHCQDLDDATTRFTAYFLYETLTCNGSMGPSNNSIIGANIVAKFSYEYGSDFLLLRLNDTVPNKYKPYFAGWDRTNTATATPGAGIHHPGGDFKKISFPKTISRASGSYNRFWDVGWYTGSQNKGVTEQGSSGSPLFNSDKRIIGQLYAGQSACNYMQGKDYYGRLYTSWNGDNTNTTSLKSWLDPDNTGVTTLDGLNYKPVPVSIDSPEEASNVITVYPNPSTGVVHFDVNALGAANYKVFDATGRCVKEGNTVLTSTTQAVDLRPLPKGNYIMQLHTSSRSYTATVIIK